MIIFLSAVWALFLSVSIMVLRGWGDSVSPLVFVSIACVCNIAGDFLTVAGLDMGPAGTAIATVFSQGISMAGAVLYLNRKKFIFHFSLKTLRIHRGILKEIVHVGIPVSFQECIVRLSFLYLTSITNGFGVNAASAVGIAISISRVGTIVSTYGTPLMLEQFGVGPTMLVAAGLVVLGLALSIFMACTVNRLQVVSSCSV